MASAKEIVVIGVVVLVGSALLFGILSVVFPQAPPSPVPGPVNTTTLGPLCQKSVDEFAKFCARKDVAAQIQEPMCSQENRALVEKVKTLGSTEDGCQKALNALEEANRSNEQFKKQLSADVKALQCVDSREDIQLGDLTYKIGAMLIQEDSPKPFSGKNKAAKGAYFVVMDYTITNHGTQTATISTDNITIVDGKGRSFEANRSVTLDLALKKELDLYSSQLQPGIPRGLVQVFELPDEVKTGLKMKISSGKMFNDDSVMVCVN